MIAGALIACAVVVAALLLVLRGGAPVPDATQARGAGGPRSAVHDPDLERPSVEGPRAETPPPKLDLSSPAAFAGRGSLRGEIVAGPGTVFPERWTLVVEPSPMLRGKERAATRRVELEHGERTFALTDLPLAGYRVRAEALGLNGTPADVLLVATSPAAFVTLAFAPAGFLDGQVRHSDGAPAEGLAVTLENVVTRARVATETDVNGAWVLRDVVDGAYRLYLGPPAAPLVPPREVLFRAPSLRVPEERLPVVGALDLVVLDLTQAPVPDTVVTGATSAGGAFEARTDASGRAKVRFLVPGTWHLEARAGEHSSGSVTVEVDAGPPADVSIHVHS
ncbi:MAG: carboxypeptidase regulatory-like domain-containing protein [Planctomycetes bacterium]|nr:carboxypeptidase regulatory-like domain-containing protein [Planctomycetota bacterium]